ncbi:MAG: MutS-related protein [Vicinamibacterales bacterium]
MIPPLEEYARRQQARETDAAARERVHILLGNAKVAIFIGILIYWAATLNGDPTAWFYGVAIALFIGLSVWHERVMRAMARANAAAAFYRAGADRIEDKWMRPEPSGARFKNSDHPYADDLDIFGPSSLFQLLSLCRTPMGESRLADWLLHAAAIPVIEERQARVAALKTRLDLRERVAVVNAGQRRFMHPEQLIAWAEQPRTLPPLRPVVVAMALLFAATFTSFMNGGSGWAVVGVAAINGVLLGLLFKRAHAIVEGLSSATASAGVELVTNVIREIERELFDEPALIALAARLKGDDRHPPASQGIARLARVSDWADSLHNAYVRLGELPFLVTLQIAYAAEAWRRRHGAALRDWVDAIGEIEALSSLAGYAYEHPRDPFAEFTEGTGAVFEATEIAHPLIPATEAVRNSFALSTSSPQALPPSPGLRRTSKPSGPQVLIVSGSNMSGKSTLMRTTGVNAVLALAGAPVRAERLRLTPLAVGTCLRHTDSLQEHRSGFYTEALRIRRIYELLNGPLPVLFLFDELLSGTNSKDRRIAAEGVVKTMLAAHAIGMVTTHDLALTEIAAIFPAQVKNVHLQDHVEDGKMTFDYKLRDGVITHSNALELMRMIGLDV